MEFPFEQHILENKKVRTFSPDVDSEELKWHQDIENRLVKIIENGGWEFQTDNGVPQKLYDGQEIYIPKFLWHRVIKGKSKLIVEITEK